MPTTMRTMTTNRNTPMPTMARMAPVMLVSLLVSGGTELAEQAASLGGGDQRFHLAPVEPESVPARAPVDVHVVHLDLAHFIRTAHAAPLDLRAIPRLGD